MSSLLPATRSARRGFTLIELLTVIAIIGILAAIIIPTVGKVRETAKNTQCISNLRQIGMAFGLYANDNKNFYPRSGQPVPWSDSLLPYLPGRGTTVTHQIFRCPLGLQPPDDFTGKVMHYCSTFAIEAGNSANAATGTSGAGPRNVSSIINPSRTLLIFDGVISPTNYRSIEACTLTTANQDMALTGPDVTGFQRLHFRHGGALNVVYVDGHTAKIPWGDRLTAIPSTDPTVWNGR